MKRSIIATLLLLPATAGCSTIVLDPIGNGGGPNSVTTTTATVSTVGGGSVGMNAIAFNGSDIPAHSIPWSSDVGAPWSDPDNLVLFLSDSAQECASPTLPSDCSKLGFWQDVIVVPPELDHVGVIDMRYPTIGVSELGIDAECGKFIGNGNGWWGTLEIVSRDAHAVAFKLRDTGGSGHPPANGDYIATRCTAPAPEDPPKAAFAVRAKDLPAGSNIDAPDPDSLVVTVTTHAETCATAFLPLDCVNARRLTVVIPPAKQGIGAASLTDPALAAQYTISATQGAPSCPSASGPLAGGTMDVRTLDSLGLSFHLSGTYTYVSDFPLIEVDGLYAATICP